MSRKPKRTLDDTDDYEENPRNVNGYLSIIDNSMREISMTTLLITSTSVEMLVSGIAVLLEMPLGYNF